ncbi:SEL1-like repeat protein [Streptomyces hirsutus]
MGDDDEVGSKFFTELRSLAAFRKDKLGGRPTDRALARRANVAPTTVGQWLRGGRFPQRVDELLVVVAGMREEAAGKGLLDDREVASLLADRRWRVAHETEAERRALGTRDDVNRARARAILAANEAKERFASLPDKPRPVELWSPEQLGVHPAVAGAPRQAQKSDFVLPAYIERPHDEQIRCHLASIKNGKRVGFVVVRGRSCTGKTRTAYEAVNAYFSQWSLVFPKDAESLMTVLAADAFEGKTILWLNEAQNYFYGESGETVAAALRRRLERRGPALLIATIWPEYHRELTATPAPGSEDVHHHARALFSQEFRIDVPVAFSSSALNEARARASDDASLSHALAMESGNITQVLAAAPDLVDHYENPHGADGPYGKAVITAAMDARRLGFAGPISLEFLEAAAPSYLTSQERAAADPVAWFSGALTYARVEIKGVASALQNVPSAGGMGAQPGVVRLADYLDQYARTVRNYCVPPEGFWSAARENLESVEELMALGSSARNRWRNRIAADLYSRAAELGSTEAMRWLAFLREQTGDEEAKERLTHAAAGAGNYHALRDLARWREAAGDHAEAMRLATKAAAAGNPTALWEIARMRQRAGDTAEAERIFWLAAEAGSNDAVSDLIRIRGKIGSPEEVEELIAELVEIGDTESLFELGSEYHSAGDLWQAEQFYSLAADLGDSFCLAQIGVLRKIEGRRSEAREIFRQAVEYGDSYPLRQLGFMEEEEGDLEEAESLYFDALQLGDTGALWDIVHMREVHGDTAGAEILAKEMADQGDYYSLAELARHLQACGSTQRADELLRYAIAKSDGKVSAGLVPALLRVEMWEELETYARQAADAGNSYLLIDLARKRQGDRQWEAVLKFGLEADGSTSDAW